MTAPIWEWLPDDHGVRIERGHADDEDDTLRAIVPRAVATSALGMEGAQQVVRVPRPGEAVVGAADPRTQGAAMGSDPSWNYGP